MVDSSQSQAGATSTNLSSIAAPVSLFARLAVLEFVSTLLIVLCTRAYVQKNYGWTCAMDTAWLIQWFAMQKLIVEDTRSRSWTLGFPAMWTGMIVGAVLGISLSVQVLGQ